MASLLEISGQETKTFQDMKALKNPGKITFADVMDDISHAKDTLGSLGFDRYKSVLNADIETLKDVPHLKIIDVENDKLVVDIPLADGLVLKHAIYNRCGMLESYINAADGTVQQMTKTTCTLPPKH